MDLLTQGLAGAVMAQAVSRPGEARRAAAIGLFAGLLADADALIRSADDPLLTLEYHRQFTHALAFVPFGALLAALLLWPFLRARLGFRRVYLFAFAGYLPSGLLDVCTSYGTQLLWPFSDARIAWNVIAIVDPVFSLTLLVALGLGLVWSRSWPARIGLGLALAYLLLGFAQHERATGLARNLAAGRGHAIERLEVKPSLGNLVLWRSIYLSEGCFHVDALRLGWGVRVYPGGARPHFEPVAADWLVPGSVQAADVERFRRFSDGFLVERPGHRPRVIGDLSYALLPNSLRPLWGIEVDPLHPERHVAFRTFRDVDAAQWHAFLVMLRGLPLASPEPPELSAPSECRPDR